MLRSVLPLLAGGTMLAGCISVKAPDKPIEINLNISVKQEVVVSLKQDAADLITNNPELFPK
ncbi:YnbE family lipoprotein [Sphingomonas abietis]|uniref:YnbE family lipoprotein n=1 Tax=Sphingomonas abietis TaxID=3012344 RepID=A0ABY7NSX5_9SPHN|nr:YnbE family lipoprotein [Sphingomonas abietis]WBO24623.1 YnbE family lipoprotein [Sphingomonas abietis]